MEIDYRELARRLRIAVRHRHDRRLLQAEQVAQLVLGRERIHQRQFGGAGISEHDLDAFLLEQIEEGALSGHDGQDVLPGLGVSGGASRRRSFRQHQRRNREPQTSRRIISPCRRRGGPRAAHHRSAMRGERGLPRASRMRISPPGSSRNGGSARGFVRKIRRRPSRSWIKSPAKTREARNAMNYPRRDAKDYAREHFKGIWAAALTPFAPNLALDEAGLRRNLRHWVDDLGIDGVFVCGKQGEFFAMSVAERKRSFDIAVEELGGHRTILSCSDQNLDTVIDLAKHAQAIGADYIVVHAPVLHFSHRQDDTLYQYYQTISAQVEIGIALWSHPDSGYLMSPELCARVADVPNVVAIKYSVPRDMYARLTRLAGDKILVSTASEEEWFDNIVELGWRLYLCSSPPYLLQTKADRRMREYTDLAFRGEVARAKAVRDSLDPVREAIRRTRPAEKFHAHSKCWQELLGQTGGAVRRPLLELTPAERDATRRAFETCGLKLGAGSERSSGA